MTGTAARCVGVWFLSGGPIARCGVLMGVICLMVAVPAAGSARAETPPDYGQIEALRDAARQAFRREDYLETRRLLIESRALFPPGALGALWEAYQLTRVLELLERPCQTRDACRRYLREAPAGEPDYEAQRRDVRARLGRAAAACRISTACHERPDDPLCGPVCPGDPRCEPVVGHPYRGAVGVASGVYGGRRLSTRVEVTAGYRWPRVQVEGGVEAVVEGLTALIFRPGVRVPLDPVDGGAYARGAVQLMLAEGSGGGGATSSPGALAGLGWVWGEDERLAFMIEGNAEAWGTVDEGVVFALVVRLGVGGAL